MALELVDGTEPELTLPKTDFRDHLEDGEFWGIPIKYFKFEGETVKLKSEFATKLEWNYDDGDNGVANINALAQTVTIDGETYSINPGMFCSYVQDSEMK